MPGWIPKRLGLIKFQVLLTGLLAFSLAGTTAVLTGVALTKQNDSMTDSILQSNFEGARNLNVSMNKLLDLMMRELGAAAKFIGGQEGPLEQQAGYVNEMLGGRRFFAGAVLLDAKGVVRASTPGLPMQAGEALDEQVVEMALALPRPFVSGAFIAPNGHCAVLVSHPVMNRDGQRLGIVAGIIDLDERNVFSDFFEHASRSKNGTYAYLVNERGQVMLNPDDRRSGELIAPEVLRQTFPNEDIRYAAVRNTEGREVLAGYLTIPKIGWGIVFQSPAEVVDEALGVLIKAQLAWILPLFVLMLLVSLGIARKLAAPFAALTAAARQISAGERMVDPPFTRHWNYEAHHLAKAMMWAVGALQHQADRMSEQARTDGLTGLANRVCLEERVADMETGNQPYALLVLDIDHFKSVNDVYGHQTGDEALVHLARMISLEAGGESFAFRFGGEEFVVLLPGGGLEDGLDLAERIRSRMEHTVSPTGRPITVSIGAAACPRHGETFGEVFERADQALYQAKRSGRNRTAAAEELLPVG
ncbi:sensor domain-containing diguanylate cyclase [Paenibacillus mucilaginosus]|uniref:Diguanylate cyclase n=1 Tax=Paenibacillus mucilaginosus (strain KNP414) TaxID=1036673 RepID=F8FKC4_PAEMK|nr:sensor domain-containing diguanylate cyclase [Paenibacillus mucilaginosus]AEI44805.1 diguanylate cyclase [Paenibacillus mucilaginosus KNP414]MCG7214852.1 sensor domain-containing diguanylate cyclase [Paenibacillus mucilaginosus]WDM26333.1 GGDEF domain-containing protein [Paenibacillus mucilaginosus]